MYDYSPISKLSDDCLEQIFIACDGCPWTLRTVSSVSRQWYRISQRPAVWHCLKINNVNLYTYYTNFLLSEYNKNKINAIKTLWISKPAESRHAHSRPLPLEVLNHVVHLKTANLCLAEIHYLLKQLEKANCNLEAIFCKSIETWCDTRRFSFELMQNHINLRTVVFQFLEDGRSGFASINDTVPTPSVVSPQMKFFRLTSIRDSESIDQRNLLNLMEEVENDRDEVYTQQDIEQVEQKRRTLLDYWDKLNLPLLNKYSFFAAMTQLEYLAFGSCYAWTPIVWREVFKKVVMASPHLTSVELHGWDQLGKIERVGCRSSTIQPIRAEAEWAITECFECMPSITSLRLVDFSIGPGLLKAAESISKTLTHLEVKFSKTFVRYFTEPADLWLLIGPLKEFILSLFSPHKNDSVQRQVNIYFYVGLSQQVQQSQYFKNDPLLESLQDAFEGSNVQINFTEFYQL